MLSYVIPQCLVTDRITIKLQLTGKSRLIFKFFCARWLRGANRMKMVGFQPSWDSLN